MSELLPKIRLAVGGGVLAWMVTKLMLFTDYMDSVGGWEHIVWPTVIGAALPIILDGLIAIGALKTPTVEQAGTSPDLSPARPSKPALDTYPDILFDDEDYKQPVPVAIPPADKNPVPVPAPERSVIDIAKLRRELEVDEGIRHDIYEDSLGNRTAGIGHLLKQSDPEFNNPTGSPISENRVQEWFSADISQAITDARMLIHDLESHPQSVAHAVINMAFNLGRDRLSQFTNTLRLINEREYAHAALEAQNSKWADQVGVRSVRIAAAIAAGDGVVNLA